jgi:MHS family proline/betaine transporter-like MFS transporter
MRKALKPNVIFGSSIATAFEWYDYALFGHLASLIGEKFFPSESPSASLLNAFLLFAVGYLMRPIGGVLFGMIGDKYGRKTALSSAVFCMAFPTGIIGLLPSYETIGMAAPIIMTIVRVIQGLSMGGALTGSASFLIEHSPENRKGLFCSTSMASLCFGVLLASLIVSFLKYLLPAESFLDWGWRIPFLFGFFIIYASHYIKTNTAETPMFLTAKECGNLSKNPLAESFAHYKFKMLISIMINSTGSVIFYLQATYLLNYLKLFRDFTDSQIYWMLNFSFIIMIFATLFSGWISDIVGRRKLYFFTLITVILSINYIVTQFESGSYTSIIISSNFLAILAAIYIGAEPAMQSELYDTKVRNTALSISYNTATTLFGGTTPYILGTIVAKFGSIKFASYYVIFCALMSLVGILFYKEK